MCLAENRSKLPDCQFEIHGTDISEDSLAKARAGVYGSQVADEVPEKLQARYFDHAAGSSEWKIKASLKECVTIARHNLMEPNRQKDYDCIFIRNVLIYFSRESKKVVIEIDEAMRKGTLSLPHGYGIRYNNGEVIGPELNKLTSSKDCDPLSRTPYHKVVPVHVQKILQSDIA